MNKTEIPTRITVSLHNDEFTWAAGYGHLHEDFTIADVYAALGEALGRFLDYVADCPPPTKVPS